VGSCRLERTDGAALVCLDAAGEALLLDCMSSGRMWGLIISSSTSSKNSEGALCLLLLETGAEGVRLRCGFDRGARSWISGGGGGAAWRSSCLIDCFLTGSLNSGRPVM